MSAPDPRELADLAKNVRSALIALPSQLQETPYRDGALVEIHPDVKMLDKMINDMFFFGEVPIDQEAAMRETLDSLDEIQGSIQLLVSVSKDYKNCVTPDALPDIEERWMRRQLRLAKHARLCAKSLDGVLALTDTLSPPSANQRPRQKPAAGSNYPGDTTDFPADRATGAT